MNKIIAIDGPAGSGKGTIAKLLAEKLNILYIDTGATYRCIALLVHRNNIDIKETNDGKVLLNGEDVTKDIRSMEVSNIVFHISKYVKLRENLTSIQRNMANNNDCVMEGRDITTIVLPNANYKIYLDASIEERAQRRFKENQEKNIESSYEEIYNNIKERDYNDMHKEVGALTRTDEQFYVDTTGKSIEEVLDIIINYINK